MRHLAKLTILFLMVAGIGNAETMRKMTVIGQGEAHVAPDMAVVNLGVNSYAPKAADALRMNSEDMRKLFEVIEKAGVKSRDVQTNQLALHPRWNHRTKNDEPPKVIGYEANNTVTVRLRDIDKVGEVLDALAQAGANRIQNISFAVKNPRPHQDKARRAAVDDAKAKAQLYADAAGFKLGALLSLSEGHISGPQPIHKMSRTMAADAVPIAQGEVGLSANVTMVYEIE